MSDTCSEIMPAGSSDALTNGTSAPFYREELYPADAAFVRSLSVEGLTTVYDAMLRAGDAFDRMGAEIASEDYRLAVDWSDQFDDRFSALRTFLMEELERRPMTGDSLEDDRRIAQVIAWEFDRCGCSSEEALTKVHAMREASMRARLALGDASDVA